MGWIQTELIFWSLWLWSLWLTLSVKCGLQFHLSLTPLPLSMLLGVETLISRTINCIWTWYSWLDILFLFLSLKARYKKIWRWNLIFLFMYFAFILITIQTGWPFVIPMRRRKRLRDSDLPKNRDCKIEGGQSNQAKHSSYSTWILSICSILSPFIQSFWGGKVLNRDYFFRFLMQITCENNTKVIIP